MTLARAALAENIRYNDKKSPLDHLDSGLQF